MHEGVLYGPIEGQGYVALKVSKSISSAIFRRSWQMTISKFDRAIFLISVLVFASHDFEVGRTWFAGGVDRQSRMGLIFQIAVFKDHRNV